jgi:Secretion system C-terminal sorting domain
MRAFIIIFFLFTAIDLTSQGARNYTVLVSAVVQKSPPQIKLNWNFHSGITSYKIYRKLKTETAWGGLLATLTVNDTTYTDNTVQAGVSYEYLIEKNAGTYNAYGFINAGIEIPISNGLRKVILLVDSQVKDSLKTELAQWTSNAEAEGWSVSQIDVARSLKSDAVKDKIVLEYQKDPENTKALFIVGHVAVPYSGFFKPTPPDAHTEHVVAWPADAYYADMDGMWSDDQVDDTTGAFKRHWNRPNDGVWDQTILGFNNSADIAVGRVDFYDMPAFSKSEVTLLKDYIKKLNEYKVSDYKPKRRALIDDNFGAFSGEAFSVSGWGNFSSLVGKENILECTAANSMDYLGTMDTASYLWSFGCGAGSYTSCSGIGTTNDFSGRQPQSVFTMLFGSYFGDWDSKNNILRAALAHGKILTNVWSGRPRWFFHHMALGGNIGESTLLSQNNTSSGLYNGMNFMNGVHIALMGDPILKLHYVKPPKNLFTILKDSAHVNLTWTVSGETVLGYNIYKRKLKDASYTKLNSSIVNAAIFDDSCVTSPDTFVYQVRAVVLESTPSGTYFNESLAASDTFYNAANLNPLASFTFTNNDPSFTFTNTSIRSKSYQWTFSDTSLKLTTNNSARTYKKNGDVWVLLTSANQCSSDTQKINIKITKAATGSIQAVKSDIVLIYPIPFRDHITIESIHGGTLNIYNIVGRLQMKLEVTNSKETMSLDGLTPGNYLLEFIDKSGQKELMKLTKE